jgi:hypothetical protein
VRSQPLSVYPQEKEHLHSFNSRPDRTSSLSGRYEEKKVPYSAETKLRFLSLPGRSLITTPTELSRLQKSTPIYKENGGGGEDEKNKRTPTI